MMIRLLFVILLGLVFICSCATAPNTRLIAEAAEQGDARRVAQLIAAGVDVESPSGVSEQSVLMRAALFGRVQVVEILLSAGADANARDRNASNTGPTPTSP